MDTDIYLLWMVIYVEPRWELFMNILKLLCNILVSGVLLQVSTSNLLRSVHVKLRYFFTRYFDRLKNCENVQSCLGLFMPHLCREIFIALTVIKIALFDWSCDAIGILTILF